MALPPFAGGVQGRDLEGGSGQAETGLSVEADFFWGLFSGELRSCQVFFAEAAAFWSIFFSTASWVVAFLPWTFFPAGFFTGVGFFGVDFFVAGPVAADFLVVAISSLRAVSRVLALALLCRQGVSQLFADNRATTWSGEGSLHTQDFPTSP
ncbi:MAG: hypothetical protein H0X43_00650 [Nitrosospira sp.]|nr:hypothetical protein [Nitrosospira sp.]